MGLRSRIDRAKAKEAFCEGMGMSDAQAFSDLYKESLAVEVAEGIWPAELSAIYEPESCLKHSGAKEVYLVVDKRSGGRVVLRASDLDANERADVEHTILSKLDFPGIPKSYGTFVKEGRSYLAREYFEGEPLDQVIARGVMQPAQIYALARQLCILLGYLHAQTPPVIHRDIKPQNIILRADGSLGLTDFGIARTFKEGSSSDTNYMGTLPYAPPEQYGYAQSSPQTDIYALGIVLIYLATGSPDRRDLEKRIGDKQLRALIEKCIAFDPKHRFLDVQQVVRRIDSLKTRKIRIAAWIAAGCVALALVGVGIWQVTGILNEQGMLGGQGGNSPTVQMVEASDFIAWNADDYSSSNDPRIGSTNWLYDYNNGGNLHGNINNGGFATAADASNGILIAAGDALYQIDADGTVTGQVYEGRVDGSLNLYGSDLFFVGQSGLVQKLNLGVGSDTVSELADIPADRVYFDAGRMYFTNFDDELNLYSAKTDGSSSQLVSTAPQAFYTNIVDGIRYYCDGNDGYRIYAQELSTGKTALLFDSPAHWLSVCNGRIYFEDDEPGRLASIRLDGTDYQVVYDEPCYEIVATTHGVFAISAIDKELVVVDVTNGEHQVVLDHVVDGFCVVGEWVVYKESLQGSSVYMVRQDGTENHEVILSS